MAQLIGLWLAFTKRGETEVAALMVMFPACIWMAAHLFLPGLNTDDIRKMEITVDVHN